MEYSVIIPVSKTNKDLLQAFEHTKLIMDKYSSSTEYIFINDSLNVQCTEILNQIKKNNKSIKLINFKKPQGEQIAVTIGITEAHGNVVMVLTSFLPENWGMIEYALDAHKAGNSVVHGRVLKNKLQEYIFKIENKLSAGFIKMIGVQDKVWGNADIEIYDRNVIDIMLDNLDRNKFIRNVDLWANMNIQAYYFEYNAKNLTNKNSVVIKYAKANRKFEKGNSYLWSLIMAFALLISFVVWLIIFNTNLNFVGIAFNLISWAIIILLAVLTFMMYVRHLIYSRLGRSYLKSELDKIE